MEPPKFTEAELSALISEAEAWLRQQRDLFHPRSKSLEIDQKRELSPFFPAEITESFRILDLSEVGETIPYPPFYEKVRVGGFRLVPDAAHLTAVPFLELAVFNRVPTMRTIFHNLVHVAQFSIVGVQKVMIGYFSVLNNSGVWKVLPRRNTPINSMLDTLRIRKMPSPWNKRSANGYGKADTRDPQKIPPQLQRGSPNL